MQIRRPEAPARYDDRPEHATESVGQLLRAGESSPRTFAAALSTCRLRRMSAMTIASALNERKKRRVHSRSSGDDREGDRRRQVLGQDATNCVRGLQASLPVGSAAHRTAQCQPVGRQGGRRPGGVLRFAVAVTRTKDAAEHASLRGRTRVQVDPQGGDPLITSWCVASFGRAAHCSSPCHSTPLNLAVTVQRHVVNQRAGSVDSPEHRSCRVQKAPLRAAAGTAAPANATLFWLRRAP